MWGGDLMDLTDGTTEDSQAMGAYKLLSRWAALKRCRPELVQEMEYQQILEAAEKKIRSNAKELVDLAMGIPCPEGWIQDAEEFADASDGGKLSVEQEVECAVDLLNDLDEADLFFAARWMLYYSDEGIMDVEDESNIKLWAQLEKCHDFVKENASLFAAAAMMIESSAATLLPEIADAEEDDPANPFISSIQKYLTLLDTLEDLQTDSPVEPLFHTTAEVMEEWHRNHVHPDQEN